MPCDFISVVVLVFKNINNKTTMKRFSQPINIQNKILISNLEIQNKLQIINPKSGTLLVGI